MTTTCSLINWWNQAPGAWAENEEVSSELYEAVLDVLDLEPGASLLDLGCGAGTALRAAADRGLLPSGLDAAPALLELAGHRVATADLRIADLTDLPYATDRFDAVTCFNALQYAADPVLALREAARVAKPGGVVAVVIWGEARRCASQRAIAALRSLIPAPATAVAARSGSFGLSEPGRLVEVFGQSGLEIGDQGEVAVSFCYPDVATAIRVQLASGPAQRTVASVGEATVRQALEAAMVDQRSDDGSYRQDNVFSYVVGRV